MFRNKIFASVAAISALLLPSAAMARDWPLGTAVQGEKWKMVRVEQGCYLLTNNFDMVKGVALVAGAAAPYDSIIFVDPILKPMPKPSEVVDAKVTLDGRNISILSTVLMEDSNMGMAVNVLSAGLDRMFNGKKVAARYQRGTMTLTGTIDPTASDLATWRDCIASIRSK